MNTPTDSIRALLTEIVDYAGLFPPSKLSMQAAVKNYSAYLESKYSWMLGRFIVPVSRLDEFSDEAKVFLNEKTDKKNQWRLSAIIGENGLSDLEKIENFNTDNEGKARIETLEIKADSAEYVNQIAKFLPKNLIVYFEIPSSIVLTDLITAIALTRTRAKIRTGGITPNDFPPVDEIVKFLRVCIAANVPFKATAGLHHPLRCIKPLTYEDDAPKGTMNGFLNLFLTSAFLRQNPNHKFVHELMNETDLSNFSFEDDAINWKEQQLSTREIEVARQKCAISFGSCSFDEPVEDLSLLNILH